ncbi:MAG TPA: carbohydrate-binding domain-containing protein, partial [Candidatus Saccharibacteria bacterium]|nr:carbohydrate-binding domain-containing protein [Candidatus Saccharibacteria bacterium]
ASESNFTTSVSITINGGNLTVEVGPGDTDAIDSNGDITITGGTIRLTGQVSTIDYDGTATFTGGTLILNGVESSTIPQGMMGGGRGIR